MPSNTRKKSSVAAGLICKCSASAQAGHIGFNEPLSALRSRTRVKALSPVTIEQNAAFFGGAANVPRRAITMGVGTILECRRCLLLATGARQGRASSPKPWKARSPR